jgi:hypothetical protein
MNDIQISSCVLSIDHDGTDNRAFGFRDIYIFYLPTLVFQSEYYSIRIWNKSPSL